MDTIADVHLVYYILAVTDALQCGNQGFLKA